MFSDSGETRLVENFSFEKKEKIYIKAFMNSFLKRFIFFGVLRKWKTFSKFFEKKFRDRILFLLRRKQHKL